MKYIILILLLLTIGTTIVYLLNQKTHIGNILATTTDSNLYTNEKYKYKVVTQTISGLDEFLINDIYKNESDSPTVDKGADYKAFYTNGSNSLIGTIFCAETTHLQDNLNNTIPLKEYTDIFRKTQLAKESLAESYDEVISVIDLHKSLLGGKEVYSYTLGLKRGDNIDINVYTVAENPDGKKCVINYPIFDYKDKDDSKILEMRLQWFNSFSWID